MDAVAEPLAINVAVKAGKLNNPAPSPTNNDADMLPLIVTLPVNSEPLSADSTLNPKSGDTDAVTLPLANLVAFGKLNNPAPSPKNEPVNDAVIDDAVISFAPTLSLISTLPVNC